MSSPGRRAYRSHGSGPWRRACAPRARARRGRGRGVYDAAVDVLDPCTAAGGGPPPGGARRPPACWACHPGPVVAVTALTAVLAVTAGQGPAAASSPRPRCWQVSCPSAGATTRATPRRDIAAGRRGKPVVDGAMSVRHGARGPPAGAGAVRAAVAGLRCAGGRGPPRGRGGGAGRTTSAEGDGLVLAAVRAGLRGAPGFVALGLPGATVARPGGSPAAGGAAGGRGAPGRRAARHRARIWPPACAAGRSDSGRGARLLLPVPLVAATLLLAAAPAGPAGAAVVPALGAVGAAVAGTLLGRRRPVWAFRAAVAVAALDAGLLMWRGTALL